LIKPITLRGVLRSRAAKVFSYPHYSLEIASRRVKELRDFGVEAVIPGGPHTITGLSILGKGHTGVVVKAVYRGEIVALKILRMDANRVNFREEARLLGVANSVGVGPRFIAVGEGFIMMELIEGAYLRDWVNEMTNGDISEFKKAVRRLLLDTYRMDSIGLDHGELVRLRRHIIYSKGRPVIIDFESASTGRKPGNVTTIVQSIYLNNGVSNVLCKLLELPSRDQLMDVLKAYKSEPSVTSLRSIVKSLGIDSDCLAMDG
jgi:putative serine/threonine protein kinase